MHHNNPHHKSRHNHIAWLACMTLILITACARMGHPDGGWYDETPPHIVKTSPAERSLGVKAKKIEIKFDEYIKIENASENVVISPPQKNPPIIKGEGKSIIVEIQDTLKPDMTYTVDFSNAISDNNEGNPLGNYTYSFSTGQHIDTMEVSGYVLEAENLEPVKGALVGLYDDMADSTFRHKPMVRVSRTDASGRFVIKGVANKKYRVYALADSDGDYKYSQKSEKTAFTTDTIIPSSFPDTRQDTIWRDSLRIDTITRKGYTHFMPDNIVLTLFEQPKKDRFFVKAERQKAELLTLYYSNRGTEIPQIQGFNFKSKDAFVIDSNTRKDTINYWIKDSTLINQDTLRLQVTHLVTDTLGKLIQRHDTLEVVSKQPYEKRKKEEAKKQEKIKKLIEKAKKDKKNKPDPTLTTLTDENRFFDPEVFPSGKLDPDKNIILTMPKPIAKVRTDAIHLYTKQDSTWYKEPFEFEAYANEDGKEILSDTLEGKRKYRILAEWAAGKEYSLEIDSTAFTDIYGCTSRKIKRGLGVGKNETYSTINIKLQDMPQTPIVAQLLDTSDKPIKQVNVTDQNITMYYVKPGQYYMRIFVDQDQNGIWTSGDIEKGLAPEPVYYYHDPIECKEKWDVRLSWSPKTLALYKQKPDKLIKQKGEKEKKLIRRNLERAAKLGKVYNPKHKN